MFILQVAAYEFNNIMAQPQVWLHLRTTQVQHSKPTVFDDKKLQKGTHYLNWKEKKLEEHKHIVSIKFAY